MDTTTQLSNNNELKKKIINEYLYLFTIIVVLYFLLPVLYKYMLGDNTGIDGIGPALVIALTLRILKYIIYLLFGIIKPIKILISHKDDLKNFSSKAKKAIYIIIIVIPIFFSILVIFERPLSNLMYKLKYEMGINAYSVNYEDYKTPNDFYNELQKRGLFYNEDSEILLNKLNEKYKHKSDFYREEYSIEKGSYTKPSYYYYTEATMMALSNGNFSDSFNNIIVNYNSNKKAPIYIYNAILTISSEGDNLQYAPIGRYNTMESSIDTLYPFFKDYYIECKILYVDGDIYSIIGLGESFDIQTHFTYNENKKNNWFDMSYPFNIILSEKENITTYVDDKYYPKGGIENKHNKIEMLPNTNQKPWGTNYKVRKVDKLDINTINNIAKELQNTVLKKSIEYHYDKKTS